MTVPAWLIFRSSGANTIATATLTLATWRCGEGLGYADGGAAAFDEHHVAPGSVVAAGALAGADGAEPGLGVQAQAGGVLGEDTGLDGPDPGGLGGIDQGPQQCGGNAAAAVTGMDVDAVLDDAGVGTSAGDGAAAIQPRTWPVVVSAATCRRSGSLAVSNACQVGSVVSKLALPASSPA